MKKMNLKRIFNWLYGDGLDRAMTERRPREDREAISPVYRPVCVSYVARTMLVCLFLLLLGGWNSQAWGGNVTLKVTAESSPSTSGYVYVAKSNSAPSSYSLTSDYADEEKYSAYVFGYLTVEQTFYLFASAKDGYGFSGWSKNSSATSGDTSNPKSITVSGKKNGTVTDGPYYAIFTPITVSSAGTASTISFSSPDTKTSTLYFPVSNGADSNSDFYAPTISGEGWSISSWKLNTSTHKVEVVCSYMAYSYTSQGDHEATVTLTTKSNNSNTGKVKANVNLTPSLVADPTSLDFGMFTVNVDSKKSKTVTLSFNVNAITFSKTDDASIAPFSATFSGDYKTLTIYYQPTSVGTGTWERDLVVYAKNNQSEQLTATQTIKLKGQAQSITNPEYTCNIADNYMVDASALDLQSLWTSTSNGTITYSIVSFTPSSSNNIGATAPAITNNRLSLGQAGTLKLKLTQASATNFYAGEDTKTITIHKYNSAFANEKDLDVKVDANVTSSYSLNYSKPNAAYIGANHTAGTPTEGVNSTGFYYTLTQTVTSSNTVGSPDATVAITYNAGNKTATGKNAGTGTIHLRQPETYKYKAASADIKVTVTKNDPVFTWKNGPYYHNSSVSNVFSSTNTDLAYTIGTSTNPDVAYESGNTLTVLSKAGTANFTVSQPGNYKWNGKSVTYSVTSENPSNHVTFTYTQAMYNDGSITIAKVSSKGTAWDGGKLRLGGSDTGIGIGSPAYDYDDKYVDIAFKGIPEKVTFEIATNAGAATGEYWYVKESSDGKNWSGEKWSSEHEGESYASFSVPLSQTARYIRLCYSGNFAGYFRNITIHELKRFTPDPSSLDFGTHPINETCASQTFAFNYANVGHNVTLATNDSHFTVTPTKITNIGGEKVGSTTVTVSYSTTEAHKSSGAKITITDELGNTATVNLSGETKRLDPTITWNPDDATFNVDDKLTAVNANELEVTLSVAAADEAYVHCEGNTATMIGAKTGTVEVTAHVTGNSIYNDKDFTKEISITNLTKQYITWEQDFSRLKTTDGTKSIVLNASSSSSLPVTYELVGDKTGLSLTQSGDTWTLTYLASECKNTTIVAKQGGDATYAPASSVSLPVKVIDPKKVCDTEETLVNSTVTLKETSVTYNIDIPQSMNISLSRVRGGWYVYLVGVDVEFYDGRNGTGSRLLKKSYSRDDIDNSLETTIDLTNYIHAKSVKVVTTSTYGYNINSLTYTKRKDCKLSKSSLSFETYPNTVTLDKTFDVEYANYPVTVECSNDKFFFTPKDFGDCSEYGTQTISVHYAAGASAGEDVGYLYIKDNTGVTLRTCTLSVTINQKVDQSITSNNIGSSYKTTDKVTLTASTNSGLSNFTYSAAPAGVAVINGAEMTFTQSGTIAVTVSEPGSTIYNATSATVENIVVTKDVPNIPTVPAGTTVTYLQKLSSSTLSGGAADITLRGVAHTPVTGAFAWTDPESVITDNAGTHNYSATFTPADGGMYTTNTCMVPVTVLRAPQAITMNNGTVRVTVGGIDAGKADSKLDLNTLIASQTTDTYAANRAGAVTYEVISENKAKATISNVTTFSATEVGTYTIRATKAQTDYYNEVTADFTVTVTRRPNTITTAGPYTKYVDEEVAEVATVVNSDGEIHTSSSDATIAYYDITNNKIVIPNSEAKSFDQTTVTIKIWQDETERFEEIAEAEAKTITLTVKKYENAILVKGVANYVNSITTDSYDNEFVFTSNNTDYTNSPIIVTQTEGNEIATYYDTEENPKVVYSNSKLGTATWSVTQAESYKYKAASNSFTVEVIRKPSASCNLYYDPNEYEVTNGITDFQGQVGHVYSIGEGQYAEAVYITAKRSFAGIADFYLQYSTDNGNNYTDLSGKLDLSTSYKTFGPYYFPANTIVTNVRTISKTGGTLSKYYKDFCVTRKVVLAAEPVHITTTAASLPVYVGQQGVGTLMVDWSCTDGGDLKLVSNNSKFTLSQDVIENTECANGKTPIIVYYTSSTAGTDNATITIYNESQNIQVAVTGVTHKTPQTIDYLVNDEVVMPTEQGYIPVHVGDVITARTNRGHLVLFQSTSDAEVMSISDNQRTLTPVANGTVTVQVHGLNTDEEAAFATVDETMRFVVTQDIIQTIVWDQTFLSLVYGEDETIDLTGYATYTDSQGRNKTRAVVYTVADESVASVEGNVLTITGAGQTTIAASVSGGEIDGETFLAASKTLKIVVRDPNAPCDTYIYTQAQEEKRDLGWNWTQEDKTATVVYDLQAYGEPRTCNFDYWGTSQKDLAGVSYFAPGIVKVEEYYDGTWHTIQDNLSPTKENQWQNSGDILLSDKATKVQVVVYGPLKGKIAFVEVDKWPTGYFFVNNMVITKARYMRPSVDTLRLGEQLIFAPYTIQEPVNIRYSNIYGPISIASDNPKFVVSQRTIAGECGDHGSYPLLITYTPTTEQIPDTAHIRISDGRLDTTIVVTGMGRAIPTYTFTGDAGTEDKATAANWDEEGIPAVRDWRVVVEKDMRLSEGQSLESNIFVIKQGVTVTVGDGATLTIGGGFPSDAVQGNIVVEAGGTLNFTDVKTYGKANIQNLTLCSSLGNKDGSGKSGQIHHIEQLNLRGDAYFEVALDASGVCSPGWYDFTVPFEAEMKSITRRDNTTHEIKNIVDGVNYMILNYDEGRSLNGWGWHRYSGGNLKPGQIYTITIDDVDNVYRFKKAKRTPLTDQSAVAMVCSAGDDQKRGWNGLGNGTLTYTNLSTATDNDANRIQYIQIYDHATNTYNPVEIDAYTFVVGSAFLVQTPVAQDMLFTEPAVSGTLQAPGRNRDDEAEAFTIELTDTKGTSVADRLFVRAAETASETYQIGRDLTKLSKTGEAKTAQMWASAYDTKLCAIESPLREGSARIALGLYASAKGEYLLDITKAPADASLYLTYDGKAIWNLSASPYTLYLNEGENSHYGLMYIENSRPVPTGFDQVDEGENVQKFVQDGVLYIHQNGIIYDVTGKKVKNINE
ncbi:MAG: hypothetical protein IJ621_00815 [Paludibacteraceae bacterium]|nr:hypothetical protein [Paludibacteraceae bacterium]